jgi:glycosyltransferase involved in cell wall biosynthesis
VIAVNRPGEALRIGIFTDDFYPHSGGVSRSIEQQLQQLGALGHRVTLFAPGFEFTPPQDCDWVAVEQWRLPRTPSYLCSLRVGTRLARRLAADHALDVVHSQNERGSLLLAGQVARAGDVPHVHTFHSNYVGTHHTSPVAAGLNSVAYLPLAGRLLRLATGREPSARPVLPSSAEASEDSRFAPRDWRSLARMAAGVDGFTSPAPYMVERITEAAPELAGRGHVVASGVAPTFLSVTRQRPAGGPVRFLSCGRLGAEKRVDAIIRAFGLLGRDDAELVIIGTGTEESALRQLARSVRHGSVRFLGRVDDPAEVAGHVADADVFVLASHHFDTQGMVLAEAAAAGTPVLYCDGRLQVGVGKDNALLTGPAPEELAEGMRALLDDPARRAAMAAASLARRPQLGGEAMANAYLKVYRGALARVSPGATRS